MDREEVRRAVRAADPAKDFVWDGRDEDDRPATAQELAPVRKRGRPLGSGRKEQVAIRLDRDLLAALRATGPGWQTFANDALRKVLKLGKAA